MLAGVCDFPPCDYGGIERWLWAVAIGARAAGAVGAVPVIGHEHASLLARRAVWEMLNADVATFQRQLDAFDGMRSRPGPLSTSITTPSAAASPSGTAPSRWNQPEVPPRRPGTRRRRTSPRVLGVT